VGVMRADIFMQRLGYASEGVRYRTAFAFQGVWYRRRTADALLNSPEPLSQGRSNS
jgi:hypothetical protein